MAMSASRLLLVSSLTLIVTLIFTWLYPDHGYYLRFPNIATVTKKLVKTIAKSQKPDEVGEFLLTEAEISMFKTNPIYLAILGKVFDVTQGKKHYGAGGGYSFFAGRDGTRAFITGDFTEEGLIDDVEGLKPLEMLDIQTWLEFYDSDYTYVGKLIGRYYDARGKPTADLEKAMAKIEEGKKEKASEEAGKQKYPPCNSEFNRIDGLRIWCSDKSGGIARDWVGVPRKLYSPGSGRHRCACINKKDLDNPLLKVYEDCDPLANECKPKKKS